MRWVFMLSFLLVAACGQVPVEHYGDTHPKVDVIDYFSGEVEAWGMVQNYRGQVVRRFQVAICGRVQEGVLDLHEQFVYDDGEQQTRRWRIEKTANGQWQGWADDIVGKAQGRSAGMALQWRYSLDLPVGEQHYRVDFDDWMYLLDDTHLVNHAAIKKWGVTVAEVTLFFNRRAAECGDNG